MSAPIKVIHYLNQFFAGIGGEEQANLSPRCFPGPKGPGQLLQRTDPQMEVVATIAAGDNYMAEHLEQGAAEVVRLVQECLDQQEGTDNVLLIAGPAFHAGRYGMACGAVCQAVEQRLQLPCLTALFPDNPAVDAYRRDVTIVQAADSVLGMQQAIARLVSVGKKKVGGEPINSVVDLTIPKGIRQNYFAEDSGATRAIEMLIRKLAGEPFTTEYTMPSFDRVRPAPAVRDLQRATIALVTSGGIVPKGNPDRIESASASKFGAYSLEGVTQLTAQTHQTVHGGYDGTFANEDPNRVLPVDAMRQLEASGRFGKLFPTYFATVGNATSVRQAVRFGKEIAARCINEGVQAVILTST